ncbi:hypothetical protein LIER_43913 [Lithospermum erythrorhizon]|uniref:Uncharacterized protein n=1 Tax=Lithospermum erythrorhizon TaxID=34254 RepID=A0AAV3R9P0_LITER
MAGGGILKDTPPPSPTLQKSLVGIIDANTLAQAIETPAEGVAQSASDQGEDSDDYPSYIVNSLPISFTDSQLWDIKEYFSIPDDVRIRVPVEGESIMAHIVDEKDVDGAFCPGGPLYF